MIWPDSATASSAGHLELGGVDVVALAREFGTPLYVYDTATLRARCRQYRAAFDRHYRRATIVYAAKAFLSHALLAVLREEGLGLDVVSGGELGVALYYGFPPADIVFHGNNKAPSELRQAVDVGVGRFVVDNALELDRLMALGEESGKTLEVSLRINPGVEAHTHEYRQTGVVDSKFGFPTIDDQAATATARALASPYLNLRGYHAHIGSQIFDVEPYVRTVESLFRFAATMRDQRGYTPVEMSPGGGLGIAYTAHDARQEPSIEAFARAIGAAAREQSRAYAMAEPLLSIEPGRSIVGPAAVALYTVGARKSIPGVRDYVSVDGGMADNIRPALYGTEYSAAIANRFASPPGDGETVTVAGKYCESGDVLLREIALPPLEPGDILAIPAAGAYSLAMASNYNVAMRPAIVFVEDGVARLVRRRETLADWLRLDVPASSAANGEARPPR